MSTGKFRRHSAKRMQNQTAAVDGDEYEQYYFLTAELTRLLDTIAQNGSWDECDSEHTAEQVLKSWRRLAAAYFLLADLHREYYATDLDLAVLLSNSPSRPAVWAAAAEAGTANIESVREVTRQRLSEFRCLPAALSRRVGGVERHILELDTEWKILLRILRRTEELRVTTLLGALARPRLIKGAPASRLRSRELPTIRTWARAVVRMAHCENAVVLKPGGEVANLTVLDWKRLFYKKAMNVVCSDRQERLAQRVQGLREDLFEQFRGKTALNQRNIEAEIGMQMDSLRLYIRQASYAVLLDLKLRFDKRSKDVGRKSFQGSQEVIEFFAKELGEIRAKD